MRALIRTSVALLALAASQAPTPLAGQRWALADTLQGDIDEIFAFVERDDPGCALGVVQDGALAYGRGYGLANLDWGIPISTSTVFDIGSVSKQFTAAAIALLDLDGVLSIDDDVRRWIPELPDYGTPITIRHLLNHTSGVRDYLTLMRLAGIDFDDVFDEHDGIAMVVRQRALNFEPGSEYLYSNSGYLMLANIVRRATGRSLRAFLEERLFDPLGMAHTSIWDRNTEVLAERATGYSPGDAGWDIDHAWNFQMGGDGQVVTSIEDMVRWDAHFYDPRVGGAELLEHLHTRGVLTSGDTIAYALGLTLDTYRGLARVQHGGSWAGFRAMLARYPGHRTSVIVQCNRGDANPAVYADRVADVVLAGRFSEPAPVADRDDLDASGPTLTAAELERWAGLYRREDRPEYVGFAVRDGTLTITQGGGGPLTPSDATTFRTRAGTEVAFSGDAGAAAVTMGERRYRRIPATPRSPDELEELAGRYHSPELDVVWTLDVAADPGADDAPAIDGLGVTLPGGERLPFRPGAPDEYVGVVTLTVVRDQERVTGLRVYAGRVTGIVFERLDP